MLKRERNPVDIRAKHIAVTRTGITTLGRAIPAVIEVPRRLFGEGVDAGGSLLEGLLRLAAGD